MWETEKREVLEAALHMVESGLAVGTMGNVSLRLKGSGSSELIAITPSGCYCDLLQSDDIVIVDFKGNPVENGLPPSSELKLHAAIYQARSDVNAIVHSHSIYGSVASVIGQNIPPIMDDQVACLGGEIEIAKYALPGSRELAQNAVSALGNRNAVILANHGTVGVGLSLREAFTNCELLEKTAMIFIYALNSGTVNAIPEKAIKAAKRAA